MLHWGECYMTICANFGYRETTYIIKDYPKRHNNIISSQAEESISKKAKAQGRVSTMMEQDTEASNNIMTGTLSLFSRDARVLFDSDATYSFVSIAFTFQVNINIEPLGCYLSVATPIDDNMIANQDYKSCLVSVEDRKILIDLLLVMMHEFDIILRIH